MTFVYLLLTFLLLSLALAPTIFNNPVQAVLAFILVFLLVAGILLSLNIEFLAFVYAIVYIGAVAVLFLFVVMLLKISTKYNIAVKSHWIVILALFLIVLTCKVINLIINQLSYNLDKLSTVLPETIINVLHQNQILKSHGVESELHKIADIFYSIFGILFIETAVILLVALIAVIVLTKQEPK